jgi:hypothetical protein
MLPSSSFWRLGSSGIWHPLSKNTSSSSPLTVFDILCATDGSPPDNYFPSIGTYSHTLTHSLASAVDTAFHRHAVDALPQPEPVKSQPMISAMQLFGSPLPAPQSHPSHLHVTFSDSKTRSGFSSKLRTDLHSNSRKLHASSTVSAVETSSTPVSKAFVSETSHSAPKLEDMLSPPQRTVAGTSVRRGVHGASAGPKRRAHEGF